MKGLVSLALLPALFLTACTSAVTLRAKTALTTEAPTTAPNSSLKPHTLTVFAAASLTSAFGEIGKIFEAAHPGVTVTFNFAGTQALRAQIEQGAPADVFASANSTEMNTLVIGGYIDQTSPQIFLTNKLVIILPAKNPAALQKLEDLAMPGLKLVLAAEDVPVGKYARQALDEMNSRFGISYKDKVIANVVSNEDDVKLVVAKVQLGEADAGIVYNSDAVVTPELKTIEIPADLNVTAKYPIAPLNNSANEDLASEFAAYVLSPEAQAVLQRWGFGPIR